MKLLVLILGARSGQYPEIINNSFNTWVTLKNENTQVFVYYGANKTEIIGNELLVKTPDNCITEKTLKAFEYALEKFEFDYIVRPNASTYVRLDKLYRYLSNCQRKNYYGGLKQTINGVTYPSGTYMIFSRDIIENIVSNKKIINENQWADDWVIGKYLQEQNIFVSDNIEQYTIIDHWPEIEILKKMYKTTKEEFDKYMFFRCKTEIPIKPQFYIRNDILKMNYLHKTLYK